MNKRHKINDMPKHDRIVSPRTVDYKKRKQRGKDTKITLSNPLEITFSLLVGEDGAPDFPREGFGENQSKKDSMNKRYKINDMPKHDRIVSPSTVDYKKRKQRGKDTKITLSNPSEITFSLLVGEDGAPDFPRGGANVYKNYEEVENILHNAFEGKLKVPKKHVKNRRKGPGKGQLRTEDTWVSLFGDGNSQNLVHPLDVQFNNISDYDENNDETWTDNIDLSKIEKPTLLKMKQKELREREITAHEERHLQNDVPRTVDEFEKLVRSFPSKSYIYIQYMAFMVSLSEIQKAREIAERALRTIHFREENEKFNVWVAYLNLENEYGTPQEESVRNIFQRALQYSDPKKMHLALLNLYDRTKQHSLANELVEKMSKKFRNSFKVWLQYLQIFLIQGKGAESQNIVKRALLSLPERKHIKFISHAAILEFKYGDPIRGRILFEKMLRDYPKRTDLWSIYIDQEIRLGDVEATRALFEKATCLSLPPKKIKFLLKKYLEFEKAHNDDERVGYVKQKALEYVESRNA